MNKLTRWLTRERPAKKTGRAIDPNDLYERIVNPETGDVSYRRKEAKPC